MCVPLWLSSSYRYQVASKAHLHQLDSKRQLEVNFSKNHFQILCAMLDTSSGVVKSL